MLFSGELDLSPPRELSAKYSGYCAIRSKPKKVKTASNQSSFFTLYFLPQGGWFEHPYFNVTGYDAFKLRVRGDGRRFMLNLGYPNMARKDDVWQCFLFSKGGPDWEDILVLHTLMEINNSI